MARNKEGPLSPEIRGKIRERIRAKKLTISKAATFVGLPSSTLNDILNGKNARVKSKKKALFLLKEESSDTRSTAKKITEDICFSLDEKISKISKERFDLLLIELKQGADLAVSAMTEIVNAGFLDRKKLREILGEEIDLLRILSKALSSEDQLKQVKESMSKTRLP